MNCRPCLYVFLVTGGFFLLAGLVIFALGVLKLVIRVKRPEDQSDTDWKLIKPASAGDVFSVLINQNAIFVLICGLLAIVLAVLILFPGWLCLRRSDRLKRRRQKKVDAEGGHVEEDTPGPQVTVQVDAHGGFESRPTDPLLSHAGVTAVEVGVNGIPRAVPEEIDDSPISDKAKLEQRYQQQQHDPGVPDGHVRYEMKTGPQINGHENPMYNLDEEKLRQHAITTHSAQQHYYENSDHSAFHSYPNENSGLGPVAPVPALAVHRVVEEDENLEDDGEKGDDEQQGGDSEDPPFANENYVYASVKRTDRHSRSPSDESATKTGEGLQQAETTSPRSSVNEEGRSALLQKAHDLVDEVLRAASDTSTSHSLRMSAEYAASQENPYDTCDSPIPSVHEEDEIPPEEDEAAREAEEEADHRSVTSSEEGDACFNAPTPEMAPSNAVIVEEEKEEEEDEEMKDREIETEESHEAPEQQVDLLIGASDIMHGSYDHHSEHEEDETHHEDVEDEDPVNEEESDHIEDRHSYREEIIEEEDEEEQGDNETPSSGYEFEDIPQFGVSEPPPPNIAVVQEEDEEEEEEEEEEKHNGVEESDPNANIPEHEEPALPAHPMDFGFGPPELIINAPSQEPSIEDEEEVEQSIEEPSHDEPRSEEEEEEEEEETEEDTHDVNANMAGAALVHISPEDDVEISELLGPQALRTSTHSEEPVEELPPPSPSPPPPPPPGLPEEVSDTRMDSPEKEEQDVDLLADMHLPAAPETSLLADLGIFEGIPADHEEKPPPPASHEQFGDLVNFGEPEDCSSTPPPPPPPPPPMGEEESWHSEF